MPNIPHNARTTQTSQKAGDFNLYSTFNKPSTLPAHDDIDSSSTSSDEINFTTEPTHITQPNNISNQQINIPQHQQ